MNRKLLKYDSPKVNLNEIVELSVQSFSFNRHLEDLYNYFDPTDQNGGTHHSPTRKYTLFNGACVFVHQTDFSSFSGWWSLAPQSEITFLMGI